MDALRKTQRWKEERAQAFFLAVDAFWHRVLHSLGGDPDGCDSQKRTLYLSQGNRGGEEAFGRSSTKRWKRFVLIYS